MNELQIFDNAEFGQIRTIVENEKILFCAVDVAKALGYSNERDAIKRHCKGVVKHDVGVTTGKKANGSDTIQHIEMSFMPEGDVYRLIVRSKLPSAERFECWVFDEVLPTIRKTGMYAPQKPMTQAEIIAQQANLLVELERKGRELEQQGKEHDNRISALEQSVADIRAIKNIQLDNWRLHIRPIINKIAQNYPLLDGMEQKDTYKAVWHELYDRLEASMRCNLKIRLANMKMRAKKAGASQQELSKLGRLDVIKENPRLVVGLKSVLHDMMIKYCNSGE